MKIRSGPLGGCGDGKRDFGLERVNLCPTAFGFRRGRESGFFCVTAPDDYRPGGCWVQNAGGERAQGPSGGALLTRVRVVEKKYGPGRGKSVSGGSPPPSWGGGSIPLCGPPPRVLGVGFRCKVSRSVCLMCGVLPERRFYPYACPAVILSPPGIPLTVLLHPAPFLFG